MRVAVIGAGIAGLSAAKNSIQQGLDVVVYEQTASIGGTWVYTEETGVPSSLYKSLVTNLPKEIMGFPDYPFPEQDLSYIPAHEVLEHLKSYADHFNVNDKVRFNHNVIKVCPYLDSKWEIIVKDLSANQYLTEIFDAVFVCNGHYSTPSWPKYPGAELFQGKQIHSHDYREADLFKDETVLIVGAGPSGLDIATELSKVVKRVTFSHHLKGRPGFPNDVRQTTDVVELTANGARFSDDSYEEFSLIIYCTGYKTSFHFLSVDSGISVDDNYVRPLYKHCINITRPTMAIIGLPSQVCVTQMIDLQVRFCLQYFTGKVPFPSRTEMLDDTAKDMQYRWDNGFKKKHAHVMGMLQKSYYQDLSETAGVENIKPVMIKIYHSSLCNSIYGVPLEQLHTFRTKRFRVIDDETFEKLE